MNNDVVIIELDRPRELRYGYKAIKRLVAMTGKNIESFIGDEVNLDDFEKIIYCGLISDASKNGETLKLDEIEDLLDLKPMQYSMEKMQEAFSAAFGDLEEEEKND